jgi:hypothetical protein
MGESGSKGADEKVEPSFPVAGEKGSPADDVVKGSGPEAEPEPEPQAESEAESESEAEAESEASPAPHRWMLALPGIVACLGLVWVGYQISSLGNRLQTVEGALGVVTPKPAVPVPENAAKLDSAAFHASIDAKVSEQLETECWKPHGVDLTHLDLHVVVDEGGHVRGVTASGGSQASTTSLTDCFNEVLGGNVTLSKGEVRAGTIRLERP